MSFKNTPMMTRKSVPSPSHTQPILQHLSPAKHRKLENVMRGMQPGITQIGFGNSAPVVDVDDLYPMDISKSIPEEKDVDEYNQFMVTGKINQKVHRMSMNRSNHAHRRRSSSGCSHRQSPKDSLSGRKRGGDQVPLQSFSNPNKRHCSMSHNIHNNNSNMMLIDDPNSRYMSDIFDNNNNNNDCVANNNNNNNNNNSSNSNSSSLIAKNDDLLKELHQLRHKLNDYEILHNTLNSENNDLKNNLNLQQIELNKHLLVFDKYNSEKLRNTAACKSLKGLLNDIAISAQQEREMKLIENNKLIGRVIQHSNSNFQISDIWEDGQLFEDLKRRRKLLEKEKEDIEIKRKELRKLKQKNFKQKEKEKENLNNNNNNNNNNDNDGFKIPAAVLRAEFNELSLNSEITTLRSASIKKSLSELNSEEKQLEHRKKLHIKFIRLMREEKKSRFSINRKTHECYVLNDRYVLTNLLGRGGFSEVHRGYDLLEHKYVACKIHQLNVHWSEERKKNYTKHATREYDIHKSLTHNNIVSLYDVFGIDVNSFCTVLEYCAGMDLDIYLKMNKILSEKESRSLIIQIFIGLKYLHNQINPIIHYDLKPGNLLYKNGYIKLTDFGLAKIMSNDVDCMELTSQGAGTYWYLPPECFIVNNQSTPNKPIMISPKVDIWSGGVIFYQMLFGKRPFGDNLSQDTILNNKTILNARNVYFPNQPKSVSKYAKDFIQQCCAYDPKLRLSSKDIVENHSYFAHFRK